MRTRFLTILLLLPLYAHISAQEKVIFVINFQQDANTLTAMLESLIGFNTKK